MNMCIERRSDSSSSEDMNMWNGRKLLASFLSFKNRRHLVTAIWPALFSAAALAFFLAFASHRIVLTGPPFNSHPPTFDECSRDSDHTHAHSSKHGSRIPNAVALAMLHFATSAEVPQQSKQEINVTLQILQKRAPCNFLVFGLWHDSLLWAVFNYGGRTVFLDESQEWIDRTKRTHPELETYRIDYHTTLADASRLLEEAKGNSSANCLPNQPIATSSCPLSLSHVLPGELLEVEWDVILIDGPRSYINNLSFPGRMSPIFSAAVMARTRSGGGGGGSSVDIVVHDVSRMVERQYSEEFLCLSNLVSSVHDLWHFTISPTNSSTFCSS